MPAIINIDVPDLDAGIEFYARATGLNLVRRLFDDTVAELEGEGLRVMLLLKEPRSAPVPQATLARDYGRHWTPVHLDFVVPDVEAATHQAMAAGATLDLPIEDFVWGRQACLRDPFGHGFCFLQWLGRGYDEVA
jgi:catechol 2,3-dioxygenase-like lactoylglutathione lyase family enzyme